MNAAEIDRELRVFGCIIPAMQLGSCVSRRYPGQLDSIIPGRERTAYFYRKTAILFAQDARRKYLEKIFPGYIKTHTWLAKSYLDTYRKMKLKEAK
jgi:hypothetical protein